ncbi:hypothetical protein ATCV1_z428L [Acanthocystis turfacea chlorella virus 1]|uniref:Uncharacterized protein z428L n=1 Tax=Chlorovirus heliozoae TaxID=322019 RepID=A7K938_9PHYC|nr:hypothetical protein ATCV1_z428L [Acanthocystis turfacea chlorella virus 1]ABT16562.1 hypothetical protein ATCV1_z428L [Acanthocystis turfacea chlorella virus 1]
MTDVIQLRQRLELLVLEVPEDDVNIQQNRARVKNRDHNRDIGALDEVDHHENGIVQREQKHIPHSKHTKRGRRTIALPGNRERWYNIENELDEASKNTNSVPNGPQDPVGNQVERKERNVLGTEPSIPPCHGLVPPVGKQQRGRMDQERDKGQSTLFRGAPGTDEHKGGDQDPHIHEKSELDSVPGADH